ncbi:hypothetical protein INT44_007239 [Umbelopsis vinacea]|uniref:Uncharacterized protein n=1 Tax=Umbelopsis vinacea TaxID=44442 RepID=A0A8H7PME6_9FUNG|nr:hypothetical protein INT44_007239 [Umbelopsis vinacea]
MTFNSSCSGLGINCVRVKHLQPEDLEYIRLAEQGKLLENVEDMYQQIEQMESQIRAYNGGTEPGATDSWTTISPHSMASPSFSEEDESLTSLSPLSQKHVPHIESTLNQFVRAANQAIQFNIKDELDEKSIDLERKPTKDMPEWTLTLKSTGMTINTTIKTFADLMHHLPQLASVAMNGFDIPIPAQIQENFYKLSLKRGPSPAFALRRAMFLASSKSVERMKTIQFLQDGAADWVDEETANELAKTLIKAYFDCQHYKEILFHRKTFDDMFIVGRDDILCGPIYAFCAAITTMRCRHIDFVIPPSEQFAAGEYFFRKARDAFEDSFDEISLENYFTLVWIAKYQVGILKPAIASHYIAMAERHCKLLAPDDDAEDMPGKNRKEKGVSEMLRRLQLARNSILSSILFLENRRGTPLANNLRPLNTNIFKMEKIYTPRVTLDDNVMEKRAILRDRFAAMLHQARSLSIRLRWAAINEVSLCLISQYEQRLTDWYLHTLPPELRISLPLLDDTLSYDDLRKRLKHDTYADRMAIDLTLQFYSSFVSLHEMLLPKSEYDVQMRENFWNWDNPEAVFEPLPTSGSNSVEGTPPNEHAIRSHRVCTQAANIIVDLLKYEVEELGVCHVQMPVLMVAWDIQLRNAQLGQPIADDPHKIINKSHIVQARQKLLDCMNIFQHGYLLNSIEEEVRRFFFNVGNRTRIALARESL